MYKLCKTAESTARQKLLEHGLMQLMQKQRFEDISVSSLCSYVGIPRNTFYRYFPSKEDALLALIDHTLMDVNENAIANWNGNTQIEFSDLEAFFVYCLSKKDFLNAIVKNDRSWLLIERAIHLHEKKQAHTNARIEPENFAEEQARYTMVYGMVSILLRWHRFGYPATPQEMARMAYSLFSSSSIIMPDVLL